MENTVVAQEKGAILVLFAFSLFCGSCILFCKNPIFSLIFLITTFTSIIMIFLILKIEFLALTFLIIYIGAIAILFLFVIMMFNLKQLHLAEISFELFYLIATIVFFLPKFFLVFTSCLNGFIFSSVYNNQKIVSKDIDFIYNYENLLYVLKYKSNDILLLSDFLYKDHAYIFGLTGLMLLTSMFGSIVLAMLSQTKRHCFFSDNENFGWLLLLMKILTIFLKQEQIIFYFLFYFFVKTKRSIYFDFLKDVLLTEAI